MLLISKKLNGDFFRAQSVNLNEVDETKKTMRKDADEDLKFEIIEEHSDRS